MSVSNGKMKVVEMSGAGGPEVLVPSIRPIPIPAPNEILVKVHATGINGPDIMQRKGLYPAPKGASDLLGLEVSGEVVMVGDSVDTWKVGDLLCGLTNGGGYAEYCLVEQSHCLPIPHGVNIVDAAGLPETYFTVWSNVFMTAGLCAGENFLVHGGAGGIGTTAIQLGKTFGANVFVTDSPTERCEICRELNADRVIDYGKENFVDIVRNAGGANVILDIVGGANIAKNIRASTHDGRIIQLAFAMGSKIEIDLMPVMLKRIHYTGSTLRSRLSRDKAEIASQLLDQVWPQFDNGNLRTVTGKIFSLSEAEAGHRMMESAQHIGKILLTP